MTGDRRVQILAEAKRLFGRSGYDSVTIKQLARACGITEPALYRHFSSKEEIYTAVLDSVEALPHCRVLFERLEHESDLRVILDQLAGHMVKSLRRNRNIHRLLLYSALGDHPKARKVFRAVRGPYIEFLTRQFDRLAVVGKIKGGNNEVTARCFVGLVFDCALGATLWKGSYGKGRSPEKIIADTVPIFIDGLSAR